jgi:hypothetical protein
MDRFNRPGNSRMDNRVPHGLSFLMWPALVRAPWLIADFMGGDEQRHEADRRRKRDR